MIIKTTNINGRCDLSGLTESAYTVTVEKDGYITTTANITIGIENSIALTAIYTNPPYTLNDKTVAGTLDLSAFGWIHGISMNEEGTRFAVIEIKSANGYQLATYSMSTPFDITTATEISSIVHSTTDRSYDIHFNNEGTKLLMSYSFSHIESYDLGTAWDLTTRVLDVSVSWDGAEYIPIGTDIFIASDGINMYSNDNNETLYQYKMSTPWDITTLSLYAEVNMNQFGVLYLEGTYVTPSGSHLFTVGGFTTWYDLDKFIKFELSTPGDITTMTLTSDELEVPFYPEGEGFGGGITWAGDGTHFYYTESNEDKVYWYKTFP